MIKKVNKTVAGVIITLSIMWLAWISAEKAEAQVYVELAKTVLNSDMTMHGIGYTQKNIGAAIEWTGSGETKRGKQGVEPMISVYYVTDPKWRILFGDFKTVIGYAYTPNQKLVGQSNFRLEFKLRYKGGIEFFARHYSSAGLWNPNTGIDSIGVRRHF